MIERRHPAELYAAELERARAHRAELLHSRSSEAEIQAAEIRVKELEIRLAASRLAQAEFYLASLKARVGFLETRTANPELAAPSDMQELAWASEALPANTIAVRELSEQLTRLREELKRLAAQIAA
jgi:hypothetical protein